MDFVSILHLAKRKTDENTHQQQQDGKFYRTTYSPPKKVCREKKHLSENIQKFLKDTAAAEAKKGIKQDPKEAKTEPEEKSNDNIRKVRKLSKSAKKAKAAEGPVHEAGEGEGDDYGYTSSEANALYEQYLEKVQHVQERKSFAPCRPQLPSETFTTIERVKAAIDRDLQKPGSTTRPSRSRTRKSDTANRSRSTSSAGTFNRMDASNTFNLRESPTAQGSDAKRRRSRSFSRTRIPSAKSEIPSSSNDKKIRSSSCAGTSNSMDPSNTFKLPAAPIPKANKRRSRSLSRTHLPSENTELTRGINDNSSAGTSNVMDPINTYKQTKSPAKALKRRSRSFSRTRKPPANGELTSSSNDNSSAGTSNSMDPIDTYKQAAVPIAKGTKRSSRSFSRTRKPSENAELTSNSNGSSSAGTSNGMDPINAFKLPAVPIAKGTERSSRSFTRTRKPPANGELNSSSNDNSSAGTSNVMDPIDTYKQAAVPIAKATNRRSRSFSRTRKPPANAKLSRIDNSGAGTSNSVDPTTTIKQPECPPVKAANTKRKSRFFSKTRNKTAISKLSNSSTTKNKTATAEETKNAAKGKKPNSKGTNAKKPPPPRKPKKKEAVAELPPKGPPAASGSESLPKKRKFPPEDVQKQGRANNKRRRNASTAPAN